LARALACAHQGPAERQHFLTHRAFQEIPVAANCDVCGKGPGFGHNISHSHRRTKRRWNPNIQRVRTLVDGVTPKRLNVCTSCLKAGKVAR
jgi:large subunit ribosomal protein L28